MIDTKLQLLMTNTTTSCCKPIAGCPWERRVCLLAGLPSAGEETGWFLGHSTSFSSLEKKFD